MKRPTWATIVGVMMIIFGIWGLMKASSIVIMPKIMEWSKNVTLEQNASPDMTEEQQMRWKEHQERMEKMMEMPKWMKPWSIVSAILTLAVSGFYIFSAINLLQVKRGAIRQVYIALFLSIGLVMLQGTISAFGVALIGMMVIFGALVSVVLDIILLIIMATGNKEAYQSA